MREIIFLTPSVLYLLVGFQSLVMAHKCLFAKKWIRFHEKASGMSWDQQSPSLQSVILTLTRISGFGFLMTGLLLSAYPIMIVFIPNIFLKYLIPIIPCIFCFGLFWANYLLQKNTSSFAPWKGSILALLMLLVGIIISSFRL